MEKGQRLAAANGACDQGIQGGGEMLRNVCRSPDEMRLKMQRGG